MQTNHAILVALAAAFVAGWAGADAPPRRARGGDINAAVVYTMQELTDSDYGLDLARQAGTDVLIRGWFKWHQAPRLQDLRPLTDKAHAFGALFGGGITCSALYDTENGLTRAQLLDMATRGANGQLVDAWHTAGIRHGSLSSPAYLDYLFRWCREQIDAGVDYLFMDEHNAALSPQEGYDDYSRADFRRYLSDVLNTNLAERADGPLWYQFREWRDDRAWKTLTDRIRAYAKERGRTVLISANGLAKYVDLQVLGIWGAWSTKAGHIDLRENQLPAWHALVQRGQILAGKRVPVVLFHDWGFGNPPFPWLAVPPAERAVWMRTRGAEIYAAGAFFAFPVLGPFGCDANKDGTLAVIAQQAAFYHAHRDLYLDADYLGTEALHVATLNLSLAAWSQRPPRTLLLHVINRNVANGALQPQKNVTIELPLDCSPAHASVISPDFAGERPAACRLAGNRLAVALGDLTAYAIAILRFERDVDLRRFREPARTMTTGRWVQPIRNEFRVRPDGLIEHADELNSYIQGRLHPQLRNPPTFLVNAPTAGTLAVHVRAVATLGARLEYRVDGATKQVVDLPDLDGKNDASASEYDQTFRFPIPTGTHRLTLDNVGGDWVNVTWFAFAGTFAN